MLTGLFTRLIHRFGVAPPTEPEDDALHRLLDLLAAQAAHDHWKIRFEGQLSGLADAGMQPEDICFDDRCVLGRWLQADGKASVGQLPAFRQLVDSHRSFHHAASNLLSLQRSGRIHEMNRLQRGAYSISASTISRSFMALRRQLDLPPTEAPRPD
ncbi:CZB domain-containing protein [Ideonella sp. 4Y11]|uniref:CZB domain-containing protein n=1 Tax=Ideonella aquatica TaxID=2824119 RepID=A0A940YEM4_9BURK|nr:CZB domain-containing protein [Ideonella aquatica]MBQ0958803.1 CZB domain-containing protein [Ideonella aquatica]